MSEENNPTKQTAVVPVPHHFVLVPTAWLAGAAGLVMGFGILATQLYIQVFTTEHPDRDLILAGVGLLTAGAVAERRSQKNGVHT